MSQSDIVELQRSDNTSCKTHIFGATVISWVNKGEELIFVSSKSHFDKKKAIRGGIPVVFPNFGPWEFGPQHGFARISEWESGGVSQDSDGNPTATFTLQDSDSTRQMWNYKFKLTYTITLLADGLRTDFLVSNNDNKEFDFTCLLHTYLKVPDVTKCTVSGLHGLQYVDKVRNGERFKEERELASVAENCDRVYENTVADHVVDKGDGTKVIVHKTNLPDTVVWNPWKDKAAGMSDFGDDEYPSMLCVEAGYVSQRKVLGGGETFLASQTITAH